MEYSNVWHSTPEKNSSSGAESKCSNANKATEVSKFVHWICIRSAQSTVSCIHIGILPVFFSVILYVMLNL